MKRYIKCATRQQAVDNVNNMFSKFCIRAECIQKADDYARYKLVLPSGKSTTVTVWFKYKRTPVKTDNVKRQVVNYNPVEHIIQNDGSVLDSNGNVIGEAKILLYKKNKNGDLVYETKRQRDYELEVRCDVGDSHTVSLDNEDSYSKCVDILEDRKTT